MTGTSSSASAQAPDRSTDEIRQNIAATRESITETVDELSDRLHQTFDWRTYIENYPWAVLGAAVGIGLLAAGLFRSRSSPKKRITDALVETVEDLTDRFRYQLDEVGLRKSGLKTTVKSAAAGVITTAAGNYLRNRLAERGQSDWRHSDADDSVA